MMVLMAVVPRLNTATTSVSLALMVLSHAIIHTFIINLRYYPDIYHVDIWRPCTALLVIDNIIMPLNASSTPM